MFEISELKEKKLSELQEIAKELKISRYSALKKLDLIYQILDLQAASPSANQKETSIKPQTGASERPKNPAENNPNQKKTSPAANVDKGKAKDEELDKDRQSSKENIL